MNRIAPFALLLLVIATLCLGSTGEARAQQGCIVPLPPFPAGLAGESWCANGAIAADQEVRLTWETATEGLRTLRLDALPDQLGAIRIVGADGRDIWRGVMAGQGSLASPGLLLGAGQYEIVLSAGSSGLVYWVTLGEPPPMPPELAVPLTVPIEGVLRGNGGQIVVPWTVPEGETGDLWTVAVTAPPTVTIGVSLRDSAGFEIAYATSPDAWGSYRLADLGLAPGAYSITLAYPPDGAPLILATSRTARPADFAIEPNDAVERALPVGLAAAVSGRLLGSGASGDSDFFFLAIPEGETRSYDVTLSAPFDARINLAVVDATGRVLAEREGTRRVSLHDFVLRPGDHFLRIRGSLPPDVTYSLRVEDLGPPLAGVEVEPNNAATEATPIGERLIAGTFDGNDRDYVALGVAGGLQLWSVEITGEGISRVSLEDGAGEVIAAASPDGGAPVIRMSRLLLPPGSNVIRIEGSDGSWLLRATALGPPVDNAEIEPNDDPSRALVLAPDVPQSGWLDRAYDPDLYTFHLDAPHRVALTIAAPADFPVAMTVSWGDQRNRIAEALTGGEAGAPQLLSWQGLLPPGDYYVDLRPTAGTSRQPYSLGLSFPSFFDRPLDLEPNDEPWRAQPVAAGSPVEGDLYGNGVDWFELDATITGQITLRAEAMEGFLYLRLARGEPAAADTVREFYLYQTGETVTLDIPAGERTFLQVGGTGGHYVLSLGESRERLTSPLEARLVLDGAPVAAFEPAAQRTTGTLRVESSSKEPVTVSLQAWLSDERWRIEGLPEEIALPPGGEATYPFAVAIPADVPDGTVLIDVGVATSGGSVVSARAAATVTAGAAPLSPHRFEPFPPAMLGGLNVAWSAVGGAIDDQAFANLIDGIVEAAGATLRADVQPVIRLATNGTPVPITGVILHVPPDSAPAEHLAAFAIEVSADGTTFRRVLEATLSPAAREQAFVFPEAIAANAVRLVPIGAQGGPRVTGPRLAEIEVIADPAFILEPGGFDLGLPALGGHVVRAVGVGTQDLTGENALWPAANGVPIYRDGAEPIEWVVGFLNGRAARITGLRWNEAADTPVEQRIRQVEVLSSLDGPLGPWTSLGIWNVAEEQDFALGDTPWVRSLRFRVVEPEAGRVWLPANIEVREAPGLSILGAWGELEHAGPYEAQQSPAAERPALAAVSTDPAAPTPLALGATAAGQVRRGSIEHWYAIELPEGTRTLRADFGDRLTPDVALALVAADGREVALQPDPRDPGTLVAEASPGSWRLRVSQPVASVAVTWDTSLSVGPYYRAIARMIRRIGWQLHPEREAINLLPFRGEFSQFLMDNWSGDPAAIYAALHAYPLRDTSSDAENALLYAALRLNERVGSRAIVIATDASYSGVYLNEPLWRALEAGGIRVFALHFPVDYDAERARAQINLMADWAGAAGGHLSRFASQGDGELAFRRLAAWLDRPADYAFALAADTTPPEPGTLTVRRGSPERDGGPAAPAAPAGAMAIILDASGSMLQRLGDARRIDIAKNVLRELGRSILPEGTPVALRVFGHDQPGSCENALFLPLGPLDRDAFVAAVDRVQSVNLARTSIAATLAAAGRDLAGVEGPKTIVLVTDGEETCGGDPLAVIRDLRASGIDVRLNIVGFAIDAAETRQLFADWAAAGAGAYFDARDQDALAAAVTEATALPFIVLDAAGTEIARGAVGGAAIPLPPGTYRLRVGEEGEIREITIGPGEAAEVTLGPR